MKCKNVYDLIEAWKRILRFDGWFISFHVNLSDSWDRTGERILEWDVEVHDLEKDASICVYLGLRPEDEFTVDFDYEYIIVNSLLQINCDCQKCYRRCDLSNYTTALLGRRLTGWIVEASQKESSFSIKD